MTSRPTGKRRKMAGVKLAPRSKSDDPDISEPTTGTDNPAHDLAEDRDPQSQVHLREAIECISEGFALYDADDRLVLCNERFRNLWGYSDSEAAPGVHWDELDRRDIQRGKVVEGDSESEFADATREFAGARSENVGSMYWR